MTLPVDHFSPSQIGAMRDCLRLVEYRYCRKLPRKVQPLNMALGNVVHKTAAQDYTHRIDKGSYLPDEAVIALADEAFKTETMEVRWSVEEQKQPDALDSARAMAQAHHLNVAPLVRPVKVEHRMSAPIRGLPVDLVGIADVIAEFGVGITVKGHTSDDDKVLMRSGRHVRDTKTSGKAPHGIKEGIIVPDARHVAQLATYKLISQANGTPAVETWLDYVWPTKGGQSKPTRVDVTQRDVELALEDYAMLLRLYESGLFPRTGRGGWICKPGKCDYYEDCILGPSRKMDL